MGGIASAWQFRPKITLSYLIDINKVDNFTSFINVNSLPWFLGSLVCAYKVKFAHLSDSLILTDDETSDFLSNPLFLEQHCISSASMLFGSVDTNKIKQVSLLHDKNSNNENSSRISCKSCILGSNPTGLKKTFNSGSESKNSSKFWHLLVHDGLPNVYLGSRKITEKGGVFVSFREVLQHVVRDRRM